MDGGLRGVGDRGPALFLYLFGTLDFLWEMKWRCMLISESVYFLLFTDEGFFGLVSLLQVCLGGVFGEVCIFVEVRGGRGKEA